MKLQINADGTITNFVPPEKTRDDLIRQLLQAGAVNIHEEGDIITFEIAETTPNIVLDQLKADLSSTMSKIPK